MTPETDLSTGENAAALAQQLDEVNALFRVAAALAGAGDLMHVLDTAAHAITHAMNGRAASLRLLENDPDNDRPSLIPKAIYNLPHAYLTRGVLSLDTEDLFEPALKGQSVYVYDLNHDERVQLRAEAKALGLVSMLAVGVIFHGEPLGTIQIFTETPRRFSNFEIRLLQAMGQVLGSAIENTRLETARQENQALNRQLQLASDVQQRMLPEPPAIPGYDTAARYVPSLDLAGDLYDFIKLDGNWGLAVADVVGKGVPASLMMASVRASLRAYAHETYNLDEILSKVNKALCRDTLDNEFVTMFYGVLDPNAHRFTYCNAGHEPPLVARRGEIIPLTTGGLIVGIEKDTPYERAVLGLEPGDTVLFYTDGLSEALNFDNQQFGKTRIEQALLAVTQNPDASAQDVLNHILWEKRRFTGLRRATDDLTLVVLKKHP